MTWKGGTSEPGYTKTLENTKYHWDSKERNTAFWICGINYYSLENALKNKPSKSKNLTYRLVCETQINISTVIKEVK